MEYIHSKIYQWVFFVYFNTKNYLNRFLSYKNLFTIRKWNVSSTDWNVITYRSYSWLLSKTNCSWETKNFSNWSSILNLWILQNKLHKKWDLTFIYLFAKFIYIIKLGTCNEICKSCGFDCFSLRRRVIVLSNLRNCQITIKWTCKLIITRLNSKIIEFSSWLDISYQWLA